MEKTWPQVTNKMHKNTLNGFIYTAIFQRTFKEQKPTSEKKIFEQYYYKKGSDSIGLQSTFKNHLDSFNLGY